MSDIMKDMSDFFVKKALEGDWQPSESPFCLPKTEISAEDLNKEIDGEGMTETVRWHKWPERQNDDYAQTVLRNQVTKEQYTGMFIEDTFYLDNGTEIVSREENGKTSRDFVWAEIKGPQK